MLRAAILFGGKSCENEISVLTGIFVLNLIDREKFLPVPIYLHTDGGFYTSEKMFNLSYFKKGDFSDSKRVFFDGGIMYAFTGKKGKVKELGKIDVALNCCHGGLGEGGGVSALMQMNGIPFASPDLTSSGVFMDKSLTKLAAKALNIPTVEYIRVREEDYARRGKFLLKSIESRLKYPVVIKPAHLGSSIGISVAENEKEAMAAISAAFMLDNCVVAERFLKEKRDVNCAAYLLNGEILVSEPEEAAHTEGIYSFAEKYLSPKDLGDVSDEKSKFPENGGGRDLMSAKVSEDEREKIRAYTRTLYRRMNLRGVVRMDFLLGEGKVYLGEVNTVPGSLAYYLFCERISEAKNFFSGLMEEALRFSESGNKSLITTGILNKVSFTGKNRGVRL